MNLESHLHQSTFPSEQIKLMLHIQLVARQIVAVTRKVLSPHDLTPQQYNVLRILRGQKGKSIAVQSLAARMIDPASNASRLLDKLESKGLVIRNICPEDRRRADVRITEAGKALLTKLDRVLPPSIASIGASIPEPKATQLNANLSTLLDACDNLINSNINQSKSK